MYNQTAKYIILAQPLNWNSFIKGSRKKSIFFSGPATKEKYIFLKLEKKALVAGQLNNTFFYGFRK